VRDRGVGVPLEDQAHVFEPFRRAANVGRIAGTGIGLAGSRQIVELHGGTIELQSREGTGSTFTIRLPLDPTVQGNSEADVDRTAPVGAGAGACAS
jgi:signal transduction histidine kinase